MHAPRRPWTWLAIICVLSFGTLLFFGLPLAGILPFTIGRTIHTRFAVPWNATAWLATGLYIAPAVSGHAPKHQALGVNVLFYAWSPPRPRPRRRSTSPAAPLRGRLVPPPRAEPPCA